ncbi:hypothetical protein WJX79_002229 [Trebouxia sp. C0005]
MPTQPWLQKCSSWAAKAGLDKLKPTSGKLLQSVQPVENNGWADLPAEVIEAVLDNLNEKDCWSSRLISSNWGVVVRDYQCGLVVPVDPRTLWSQSSSFRQRQAQYPRTRFTFKLARPFDFGECAELLSATVNKEKLANCDLQLTLVTKESISPAQSDSRSASACGVLNSSRQTLERIILTSRGWDTATLSALDTLPKLHTVTIKVLSLTVEDAIVLSHLLQPSSIQIMLRKCSKMVPEAFTILSSSQANITHLEASNLVYIDLQGVKITRGGEKLLESTICAQQKAGKLPLAVAMVLPKFSKRFGDNVFTPECLHYPAFAPIPDGRRNMVICGSVNKNQELKDTIVAVQGMQLSRRCGGIGSGWVSKLYGSDTAPVLVDRQSGAPAQVVEVHYSAYQIAPAGYDGTNFGLGQFGGTLQRALQLSALSAPSSLDW